MHENFYTKSSVFTERERGGRTTDGRTDRQTDGQTERVHMTAGLNVLAATRGHVMTTAL